MSTKPLPKLKANGWDALVAAGILAAALGLGAYFWSLGHTDGSLTAALSVDGKEEARISLTQLTEETERTVVANGYTLHLLLTPEGVTVTDADCPTQDCVHTGTISRGGSSIVCLPARVAVTLEGAADDGVDAVIG